jgi:hypothetical protein
VCHLHVSCVQLSSEDAEAQRRKRLARRAALASLLLFAPLKKLRPQIAVASHGLGTYFDAVDSALATSSLSTALKSGTSTIPTLTKLIRASMIRGYEDGGSVIGKKPGSKLLARADVLAKERATEVSRQMFKTSKKWLKDNPDHDFALSSARADRAARFEATKSYYEGVQKILWGYGVQKSWLTTSEAPCEECVEQEDEGPIPLEEPFPCGLYAPLLHLYCECQLALTPLEDQ